MSKNECGNFDGGRTSKGEKKREQWSAYWLSEYRRWLKLGCGTRYRAKLRTLREGLHAVCVGAEISALADTCKLAVSVCF